MKDARESVLEVAKFKEHILKNLYTMIVRDANYFKFYRKTCLGTHTTSIQTKYHARFWLLLNISIISHGKQTLLS